MRKLIAVSFLIVFGIINVVYAQYPQTINKQIQALVDEYRESNHLDAYTLAISFPDEQVPRLFNSGQISKTNTNPVHVGSLFQVGSISKSFVAATILQLQQQNQLTLDDTLSSWLPEYQQWSDITLRQLLNHTIGGILVILQAMLA